MMASANGYRLKDDLDEASQEELSSTVEKYEMDCLKLIDAVEELDDQGEKHTLRKIAGLAGLSKDEVNRYLTQQVNEVYNLERLKHVRSSNRALYNHLITSGPPRTEGGEWVGIEANTSKFKIFQAVATKYGYSVEEAQAQGRIVELEYHGIEELSYERQGMAFSFQEPVLYLDQYRPEPEPSAGA